jgi:hypothetical protein
VDTERLQIPLDGVRRHGRSVGAAGSPDGQFAIQTFPVVLMSLVWPKLMAVAGIGEVKMLGTAAFCWGWR